MTNETVSLGAAPLISTLIGVALYFTRGDQPEMGVTPPACAHATCIRKPPAQGGGREAAQSLGLLLNDKANHLRVDAKRLAFTLEEGHGLGLHFPLDIGKHRWLVALAVLIGIGGQEDAVMAN